MECTNCYTLIQGLIQEIDVLRNEVRELKTQNEVLFASQTMINQCLNQLKNYKVVFFMSNFLKTPTVEYLQICDLNYDALSKLFERSDILDFSCGKYLIDCYANGTRCWDEMFPIPFEPSIKVPVIIIFCGMQNEQIVNYALDVCFRLGLDAQCKKLIGSNILYILCKHYKSKSVMYVLDAYVKYNIDFDGDCCRGWTPVHLVFEYCDVQVIKHIINIYIEKNTCIEIKIILTSKDPYGYNPLQKVCLLKSMDLIKFTIDVWDRYKLNMDCVMYQKTLVQLLNLNRKLKDRAMQMYLNELERDVFC